MAKVVSDLRKITPAMAKKMLDQNVCNRQVRTKWVDQLCKIILDGCWHVTHQGVAFDTQNRLIDGQHRLMAIVKANKAVDMYVTYNLEPDAIYAIDQGKLRSVMDVAGPLGGGANLGISSRMVATARSMKSGCISHTPVFTNEEMVQYICKHRDALSFAIEHLSRKPHTSSVLAAVVARAYYTSDLVRLADFCKVISTNIPIAGTDEAALTFNRWFIPNVKFSSSRSGRFALYTRAQNAIKNFLGHVNVQICKPVNYELYLTPGEGV
jgi:hypothetical protein